MRWLLDEKEIDRSPMERMRPPIVPEKPVPVLTEAQLRALLASAKSASFVDRREAAIIRLLLDTGGRLSEGAGLAVADLHFTEDVAHVIGKGRRPRALPSGSRPGSRWAAICVPAPRSGRPTGPSPGPERSADRARSCTCWCGRPLRGSGGRGVAPGRRWRWSKS